jgi:hypothetical protein
MSQYAVVSSVLGNVVSELYDTWPEARAKAEYFMLKAEENRSNDQFIVVKVVEMEVVRKPVPLLHPGIKEKKDG